MRLLFTHTQLSIFPFQSLFLSDSKFGTPIIIDDDNCLLTSLVLDIFIPILDDTDLFDRLFSLLLGGEADWSYLLHMSLKHIKEEMDASRDCDDEVEILSKSVSNVTYVEIIHAAN